MCKYEMNSFATAATLLFYHLYIPIGTFLVNWQIETKYIYSANHDNVYNTLVISS